MKLVAVNGRAWSRDVLREAIRATKTRSQPLELLVENGDSFKSYKLDYRGGGRYPTLERDSSKPDLLSEIGKPHAAK